MGKYFSSYEAQQIYVYAASAYTNCWKLVGIRPIVNRNPIHKYL